MGVLKEFWQEEDAVGVVEIILILVYFCICSYGSSCSGKKDAKHGNYRNDQ